MSSNLSPDVTNVYINNPHSILNCLKALSYTPQEVQTKIIKRKAKKDLGCCGCYIIKDCNEWLDTDSKEIFCDECALKYGWRKEQPIDFLINNLSRCFLSLKERYYRFNMLSPRHMIFPQIARYIDSKNYYKDLIILRCTIDDTSKENILTDWLDNFKNTYDSIYDLSQYDCEANYIILINLLNNFPLDLYIDIDIQHNTQQHSQHTQYHPYNLRHKNKSKNKEKHNAPSSDYTKYTQIITDIKDICTKGLEIYFNEWNNDPLEYFEIINKKFPLDD
jgi:hypothetical protein